jgi:hypothetical protein
MHRPPRSCRPPLPIATFAALALLGTSCVHHDGRALHLGWREYPHEREQTLEPQDLERLLIEVAYGDLELLGVEGPTRIVATLHERHPGAGELWLEDGRLGVRSRLGDDDVVLGAVRVELGTPLVELVLG